MPYDHEGNPKYHQEAKPRPVSLKGFIKIALFGLVAGGLCACLLYIAAVV